MTTTTAATQAPAHRNYSESLADYKIREDVTVPVLNGGKNAVVHSDSKHCLRGPDHEPADMEWLKRTFANEVAREKAGKSRTQFFCTRCLIVLKHKEVPAAQTPADKKDEAAIKSAPDTRSGQPKRQPRRTRKAA